MSEFPYKRVVVIGVTSAGKSTLAETLARRFGMDFIELDALHWEPNWKEAPLEVFQDRVEKAIRAEKWSVAGNYHIVRDLIWPKAEAVIWLDYPFMTVFWQLSRRTFKRWWTRELLWGTNVELLSVHFKIWSQDSLFHWLLKTYWRRKREIPTYLAEYPHLQLVRFAHPKETQKWLKSF